MAPYMLTTYGQYAKVLWLNRMRFCLFSTSSQKSCVGQHETKLADKGVAGEVFCRSEKPYDIFRSLRIDQTSTVSKNGASGFIPLKKRARKVGLNANAPQYDAV